MESYSPHPLAEQAQSCGRLTQAEGQEGPIAPVETTDAATVDCRDRWKLQKKRGQALHGQQQMRMTIARSLGVPAGDGSTHSITSADAVKVTAGSMPHTQPTELVPHR